MKSMLFAVWVTFMPMREANPARDDAEMFWVLLIVFSLIAGICEGVKKLMK